LEVSTGSLYAAINPDSKRIIYAKIYPTRNHLTTKSFFKDLKRIYGKMPKRAVVVGAMVHCYRETRDSENCNIRGYQKLYRAMVQICKKED
jgi:transposase-like protein